MTLRTELGRGRPKCGSRGRLPGPGSWGLDRCISTPGSQPAVRAISMRRLRLRLAGESFGATGLNSENPAAPSVWGGTPLDTR